MSVDKVKAAGGYEYNTTPPPPERPVVHAGEVAATLFNDLGLVFRRIQAADAFEAKVVAAAKSPSAWLLLREELNAEAPK